MSPLLHAKTMRCKVLDIDFASWHSSYTFAGFCAHPGRPVLWKKRCVQKHRNAEGSDLESGPCLLCRSQAELLDLKRCHEAAAQLSEAVTVEFCRFFYTQRVNKMEMVYTVTQSHTTICICCI